MGTLTMQAALATRGTNPRARTTASLQKKYARTAIIAGVSLVFAANFAYQKTALPSTTARRAGIRTPTKMVASADSLRQCFTDCTELIKSKSCAPILVRLAWHDSGNYDKTYGNGGANGSIRFSKELAHGGNAGLMNAVKL